MELKILESRDKGLYDAFIAASTSGSFLQSWDWGDWQERLGRKSLRYIVTRQGEILLACQTQKMKIAGLHRWYLYLTHGPLLAAGLDDITKAELLSYFFNQLQKQNSEMLFFRIEPPQDYVTILKQNLPGLRKTRNIQAAKTILLDLTARPEQLLAAMHPKTRYNIKVAQKHGVSVLVAPIAVPGHGLYLKESTDLIVETARRQHYKDHGATYYESLIDFFGPRVKTLSLQLSVYQALYQGKLLASAIMIDFGQTRMYLFGGSSDQHRNVMAPHLLHWQAITDAQQKGLIYYDFGGSETAGGKDDFGFTRFKLGFGGRQQAYVGAYDLIQRPLWYTIYTLFRSINRIRNKLS